MKDFFRRAIGTLAIMAVVAICGAIDSTSLAIIGPAAMMLIHRIWCRGHGPTDMDGTVVVQAGEGSVAQGQTE